MMLEELYASLPTRRAGTVDLAHASLSALEKLVARLDSVLDDADRVSMIRSMSSIYSSLTMCIVEMVCLSLIACDRFLLRSS